jgi:hypothetical protein
VTAHIRGIGLVVGALALWASSASARDVTCFDSAEAVRRQSPGAWPSWTWRAVGHEGRKCWYASARASAQYHNHLVAVGRSIETDERVEPSTKGFETRRESASPPQRIIDTVRPESAPEPSVRAADAGEGSVAVTGSIVSVPAPIPADQIVDRPALDAHLGDAETSLGLEPARRLSVAASAPATDERLPVWKMLAIFVAALAFASIAARAVFRRSGVLPI